MIAKAPTTEEIRKQAFENVPLEDFNVPGRKDMGINLVMDEFLRLQFRYFPSFCDETRRVNLEMIKELADFGHKTPTRMIGGKVYEGTSGWSKDGKFKHKWIIPQQLRSFMMHVYKDFWEDSNAKDRDKFMKGILKGEDYYALLDGVYKKYGSNVIAVVTKEDREAVGLS